jgi:hypothetical protein
MARKIWLGLLLSMLVLGVAALLSGCDGCSNEGDFCPIPALSLDGRSLERATERLSAGFDLGRDLYGF